jgi:hypothetical protein
MDPALKEFFLIVGAALAAYFGAYFKRRGEDKAMNDGFKEVLRQARETTDATKRIEARITDEMWDRQKRWEMKRDFIFGAANSVGKMHGQIVELDSAYKTERRMNATDREQSDLTARVGKQWTDAMIELGNVMTLSSVVCGDEMAIQFKDFTTAIINHGEAIMSKGEDFVPQRASDYGKQVNTVYQAMKKELAKPLATSQSNESSAAPTPAPPTPEAK